MVMQYSSPSSPRRTSPLDPNDDDGDGLNNSWEKSYGSDPDDTDSDDDGVSDGDEHNTGTDPMDDGSAFVVARLLLIDGVLTIEWDTVLGKKYQVEFTADNITDSPSYSSITAVITASDVITQSPVPSVLLNEHGCFRVRWIP